MYMLQYTGRQRWDSKTINTGKIEIDQIFRWTTKWFQQGRKTKICIWSVTRRTQNWIYIHWSSNEPTYCTRETFLSNKHRDSNWIKLECFSNNIVAFSNCTFPTNSTFIKSIHLQPATQHSQSNSLNSPVVHILAVLLLKFWRPLMEIRTSQNVKSKDNTIIQTSRRGLCFCSPDVTQKAM